jgi:FdhE protein
MMTELDAKVLERLEDWGRQTPPGPIELYLRLMRLQIEAKSGISLSGECLPKAVISERLFNHIPLLTFDDLEVDWDQFRSIFRKALSIINEYVDSIDLSKDIPLEDLAKAWYNNEPLSKTEIDRDSLLVALHAAMKPFLMAHAEVLITEVEQSRWRRGYCPICGSKPNFAYLSKEPEGARWLICPRCNTEWLFQRVECPFCGNNDQKSLAYLSDDSGVYRVYTCERCKCYLKSIDMRNVEGDVLMPLQWVATLDLDRQACEAGYTAGDLTRA